jgi:hypothetical protein
MIDARGTWSKGTIGDDNLIRLVVFPDGSQDSFFEAHRTDYGEKKRRFHMANVKVTKEDLRELRDHLNSLDLGGPKPEFDIILHKGKPLLLLEVANAFRTEINGMLDEYLCGSHGFFGDTDFINLLKSKEIKVISHPFEELTTGVR